MGEECLIAFGVLVLIALALVVQGIQSHSLASRRRGVYSGLAKRFKGQFTVSTWGGKASLWFRHGNAPILIRRFKASRAFWKSGAATQFSAPWLDHRMHVVIVAREWASTVRRNSRDKSVSLGHADLDQAFVAFSRRPDLAPGFLHTDALAYAQRFIWPYRNGFRLRLYNGRLTIETRAPVESAQEYEGFIRFCIELFDQAQATREAGIAYANVGEAQIVSNAKCPVCSEALTTMVVCKRCRTPHHEDCWNYYGGCSVYGCRETAYEHVLQAEVLSDEETSPSKEE
jgi:hypothetical protein